MAPDPEVRSSSAGRDIPNSSSESDGKTSTTQYTLSSTPSFALDEEHNADIPLPSIERDTPSSLSINPRDSPSLPIPTPSESNRSTNSTPSIRVTPTPSFAATVRFGSTTASDHIFTFSNPANKADRLNLDARATPPRHGHALRTGSSPSGQGTPTPSNTTPIRLGSAMMTGHAFTFDRLADGVDRLGLGMDNQPSHLPGSSRHLSIDSLDVQKNQNTLSPSPSKSRRRSSSGVGRITHFIENKERPEPLFHEKEFKMR
ncbi:hypothetical protein K469DRAFT_695312 [Zopfia rhizophila CBS 207.26]|uniref:Uncharacterized protein n=1 Tax=Zopfia rhizophila CBS 207.26 TaxID=1314779 RepID=A0A6A6DGA8_9PEZI|nr:hypothetical protein K469DRAFT_695312 [Zopfia rhizophila CBS 207.26]